MVYRVCVEKKPGLAPECASLLSDCRSFLDLKSLENVRIWNRYDVEGIAVLVLLIAIVNFINFSTALTPVRVRGINVRRICGESLASSRCPASSTSARTARRSASSSSARASARASARRRSTRSTARSLKRTSRPSSTMSSTLSRAARPRLQSPRRWKRTSRSPRASHRSTALPGWMNRRSRRFFRPWALRWT